MKLSWVLIAAFVDININTQQFFNGMWFCKMPTIHLYMHTQLHVHEYVYIIYEKILVTGN